ncbi:MAG: hypothetical protein A4E55_01783 [Pelotomaculum sp. PtaU1.Bin035]|nr:MAG: hypothetical protein A4E55_01783 [Pelotomaculum sp. PtaU1.Bin035]
MAKSKVLSVKKQRFVTWREVLEGFLFWRQAQGLSETTINDYRTHVNIFLIAIQKRLTQRI